MSDSSQRRIAALWNIQIAHARSSVGIHMYDGVVQDLSPNGITNDLLSLGRGQGPKDLLDLRILEAKEAGMRVLFGRIRDHRRNPIHHIRNLDLSCYDREYAPASHRREARLRHLSNWPDAVDAAIEALDDVPAPVARALLGTVRGLAGQLEGVRQFDGTAPPRTLRAHKALVAHILEASLDGNPDSAIGSSNLAALYGESECVAVDLGELASIADLERDSLRDSLRRLCKEISPETSDRVLIRKLLRDCASSFSDVAAEAQHVIDEAKSFVSSRLLMTDGEGSCQIKEMPTSRSWATAFMDWAGPNDAETTPAYYYISYPDESLIEAGRQRDAAFLSRTLLPVVTIHEVIPGHLTHSRAMRQMRGDVRRTLHSQTFIEGWAHYVEELFVEEGFRSHDLRFAIGVTIAALLRATRLAVSVGIHTKSMSLTEARQRFIEDAFLPASIAQAEAVRATFDPTYGGFTWGKVKIRQVRKHAQQSWGTSYSHRRFHDALLGAGSPPLGLLWQSMEYERLRR